MAKNLVEIEGFNDLQRALERAGKTAPARKVIIPVLKSAARPTLLAAKAFAPKGSRVHHRYPARKGSKAPNGEGNIIATYYPGNLSKSIGILTVKDRKNAAIIVAPRAGKKRVYDGFYAHMVEDGTVNMEAQPFMRPAFTKTKGLVAKNSEKRVAKVIQRQILKQRIG